MQHIVPLLKLGNVITGPILLIDTATPRFWSQENYNTLNWRENILLPDGFLELDKASSIGSNGVDACYATQLTDRYEYANLV